MGEEERRQQAINLSVNLNVIKEGDSVRVAGDHVEKKTEVRAGVVENVNMNAGQETEEVVRGNIHGDSTALNSGEEKKQNRLQSETISPIEETSRTTEEPVIGQLAKLNLTESNLKASISEMHAQILVEKGEYDEAIDILEEILPTQANNIISTLILLVKCYGQIGRKSKVSSLISSITEIMSSSVVYYKKMQENIKQRQDSHPIQTMILRGCLSGVIGKFFGADEEISKIRWECSLPICQIITKLAKDNRAICKNIGIPLITSCLEYLRNVSGADEDMKVKMEANCLNDVGNTFRALGELSKAIEYYQRGVEVMESHFELNASKYRVLGFLLNHIGAANEDLGQFKKAEEFYLKSRESKKKAADWSSDAEKQESIKITKNNLHETRKEMKKNMGLTKWN